MTILSEGVDFNTVVEYGHYSIKNGVNSPDNVNYSWYNLIVFPIANDPFFIHQIAIPIGTTFIYIRFSHAGNFSDWYKVTTELLTDESTS